MDRRGRRGGGAELEGITAYTRTVLTELGKAV